jgi:hypothetical protein
MRTSRVVAPRVSSACLLLVFTLAMAGSAAAQQKSTKKPLSEALRAALAKETPAVVQKRFTDEINAGKLDYEIDVTALNGLSVEYLQKGEREKGMAVLAVTSAAGRLLVAEYLPPELVQAAKDEQKARDEEKQARASAPGEEEQARARKLAVLGPARNDLDRFHGLFRGARDPEDHSMFLVRDCDGHLQFGATWADVGPWPLRSIGDTEFEYPGDDFTKPFHVHITTGAGGRASRIEHDQAQVTNPLTRVGDLPVDFLPKCASR